MSKDIHWHYSSYLSLKQVILLQRYRDREEVINQRANYKHMTNIRMEDDLRNSCNKIEEEDSNGDSDDESQLAIKNRGGYQLDI